MTSSRDTMNQAFHLFCMGISYEKIASVVGVSPATVPRWIDRYDWRNKKKTLLVITEENDKNDKGKLNEQLLSSIKRTWAKSVQEGLAKTNARDVIETIKLERLIEGESTENVIVKSELVDDFDELYREARRLREDKKTASVDNGDE